MNFVASVPESQHANLVGQVQADLIRLQDEHEISAERAYLMLCVNYLGFSLEQGIITDGKDDCGIDFLESTSDGVTILQAKSVDASGRIDEDATAGTNSITDLPRIRNLFTSLDNVPTNMKASLKRAIVQIKSAILGGSLKDGEEFNVTVYFCYLGKGFTAAAESEFHILDQTRILYGGRHIKLTYIPVFLPDLIEEKWRETNTRWFNNQNKKVEDFDFPICGAVIRDAKSAIFFTKASALVAAYKEIGYQIFESNVRCEIKNSSVNKAIRNSILSHRGRGREFKHLNNGTTIICDNFKLTGPQSAPTGFRVRHPGIINGLQTVKTIHDAVGELGSGLITSS